jgi:FkbM family methyltransferase
MSVRGPFVVAFVLALIGALAHYVYRDLTAASRRYRIVQAVAPCDPDDPERRVFTTPEGKFCFEPDSDDTIKSTLLTKGAWEPELVEQFRGHVHPGDLVVDAGAYIGEHTMQLARLVGPTGQVVAFEPQLRIYEELLVNLDLNHIDNVRAEFAALGNANQRVSMNVAKDTNAGATRVGAGGNRVELRTLDSYRLDKVAFMKIDVEGFEYQLLEGARATIARDHPVLVIEIWGQNQAHVLPLLAQYGYHMQQLAPDDFLALP